MRIGDLEWLDAPPEAAWQSAEALLDRLGATEERVHQLARYPLHPRLSRILVAAMERGVVRMAAWRPAQLGSGAALGEE